MIDRTRHRLAILMLALAASPAHAEEREVWRLFVSDHEQGVVSVVDLLERQVADRIEIAGPASVYRTESGKSVFAVQGGSGRVDLISSGIAFEDHGDHSDIAVEAAKLVDYSLSGEKPAHFVERQGNVLMWFDGEPAARMISEADALTGSTQLATFDVGAAHHGVGVPFSRHAVVTVPNPEDASKRPIGARVVAADGSQVGEVAACPGLHGSAGSGDIYALACDTGLLLIRERGGVPEITHLAYSPNLPDGSASTLIGGKGIQYFVGNYGADRIVLIDPSDADSFRLVQLPTRRVHFVTDPIRPKFVYVFTEDGRLHQVDFLAGAVTASLELTEPYSMDGHWSDPRPRLAVAGDQIVITDPLSGRLHLVDAESFELAGTIDVNGKPFNVVAVGGSGRTHEHD